MSQRFITYVIIGVAFGFTQLWFVYWVVKLFKEKQRILKARREARTLGKPGAEADGQAADGSPADSDASALDESSAGPSAAGQG